MPPMMVVLDGEILDGELMVNPDTILENKLVLHYLLQLCLTLLILLIIASI